MKGRSINHARATPGVTFVDQHKNCRDNGAFAPRHFPLDPYSRTCDLDRPINPANVAHGSLDKGIWILSMPA